LTIGQRISWEVQEEQVVERDVVLDNNLMIHGKIRDTRTG
jgi:hypothetical protein